MPEILFEIAPIALHMGGVRYKVGVIEGDFLRQLYAGKLPQDSVALPGKCYGSQKVIASKLNRILKLHGLRIAASKGTFFLGEIDDA
jgi:hypothetical protein